MQFIFGHAGCAELCSMSFLSTISKVARLKLDLNCPATCSTYLFMVKTKSSYFQKLLTQWKRNPAILPPGNIQKKKIILTLWKKIQCFLAVMSSMTASHTLLKTKNLPILTILLSAATFFQAFMLHKYLSQKYNNSINAGKKKKK